MSYIPRTALKLIDKKLKEGTQYYFALLYVADQFDLNTNELRKAHEKRSKAGELLNDALLALGMLSAFLCPVFFYLLARA
jgi:hypothetical protein